MARAFSIRSRILLLACGSVTVALALACAGFALNGVQTLRNAKVRQLSDQVRMVAFHAPAIVTLRNEAAGKRLLDSLRSDPTIEAGCILDEKMQVIASKGLVSPALIPHSTIQQGHRFIDFGHIEVLHPVAVGGRNIGSIYLRANTKDLQAELMHFARIAGYVLAFAMSVALILAMAMQRSISRPLQALTHAAQRIALADDYSIRVEMMGGTELRMLQSAFNRMLDHIQKSDYALQQAHADLEQRVEARTQELSLEIARRKRIQHDLERAKEAAESANHAKSEFLANVSHEIRTPLNSIIGFTDLLIKDDANLAAPDRHDHLDTIRRSGVHLADLINDVLDLSKIEAGRLEVERIPVSPHEVISDVVATLGVRARQKGLVLLYEWSTAMPERIASDPARLRQLLTNLVGNAIKFTEKGTIRVVASLTTDPSKLRIDVIDSGIGIPTEKLESIFDPFTQADTSVTRRFGGTGLGLAISRKIAAALGGTISVTSRLGEGSTFSVAIDTGPLANVPLLTSLPAAPAAPVQPTRESTRLPPIRILVVDDGETNRKLLRLILQRAGAKSTLVENGLQALQYIDREPFDLVLMDMQMPVLDGYSATRQLRARGCRIPIVALTAHAMKGDEEKCREAGCTGYMAKPIDADRLLATIGQIFGAAPQSAAAPSPVFDSAPERIAVPSSTPGDDSTPIYSTLPMDDLEFREIVEEFIQRFREKLLEMKSVHQSGKTEELARLAHWLKGAGGSAGFPALNRPAISLEAAAKANRLTEIDALFENLSGIAARIGLPPLVGQPAATV